MAIPQFVAGVALTAAELNVMLAGFDPTVWTATSFANGWVNTAGNNQLTEYRKIGDVVHIRGMISSGTLTAGAFTLPAGFRPPKDLNFAVVSNGAFGHLYITSAGVVIPQAGSNASFSLCVSFSTIT